MAFDEFVYLYIEDDPLSREVMQRFMENAMDVTRLIIFEDSKDFIQRLNLLNPMPDLIMVDIHIKPIDGFEMLELIRAHPLLQEAKVIALTASVMNEEVEQLRTAGFDGAIAKPLSFKSFPGLIAQVLQGEVVWHIIDDWSEN